MTPSELDAQKRAEKLIARYKVVSAEYEILSTRVKQCVVDLETFPPEFQNAVGPKLSTVSVELTKDIKDISEDELVAKALAVIEKYPLQQ